MLLPSHPAEHIHQRTDSNRNARRNSALRRERSRKPSGRSATRIIPRHGSQNAAYLRISKTPFKKHHLQITDE